MFTALVRNILKLWLANPLASPDIASSADEEQPLTCHDIDVDSDDVFETDFLDNKPHLQQQDELNDLVRDLQL